MCFLLCALTNDCKASSHQSIIFSEHILLDLMHIFSYPFSSLKKYCWTPALCAHHKPLLLSNMSPRHKKQVKLMKIILSHHQLQVKCIIIMTLNSRWRYSSWETLSRSQPDCDRGVYLFVGNCDLLCKFSELASVPPTCSTLLHLAQVALAQREVSKDEHDPVLGAPKNRYWKR